MWVAPQHVHARTLRVLYVHFSGGNKHPGTLHGYIVIYGRFVLLYEIIQDFDKQMKGCAPLRDRERVRVGKVILNPVAIPYCIICRCHPHNKFANCLGAFTLLCKVSMDQFYGIRAESLLSMAEALALDDAFCKCRVSFVMDTTITSVSVPLSHDGEVFDNANAMIFCYCHCHCIPLRSMEIGMR